MNVVAVCFVLSSLAPAGILSAQPDTQKQQLEAEKKVRADVIVKEGQRVIVFEYEKEGLSISPHKHKATDEIVDMSSTSTVGDRLSEAAMTIKERAKEAASVLPNLGQGLSTSTPPSDGAHQSTPGELICDTLGKCKHQVAGVFSKAKDIAQEGTEHAKEKAKAMAAHLFEEGSDKAKGVRDAVIDMTRIAGENLAGTISDKMKKTRDEAAGKMKQAEEKAEDVVKKSANQVKENLKEVFRRGHEVVFKAMRSRVSPENRGALMGVVRLLGFATAYGMSVWVTFVSGYVLAEAQLRQQFGIVQSKIYPVYFRAMAYSIGLSLLGLWFSQGRRRPEKVQSYNLLAFLMVLANLFYLEPRASKVMFERMKIEKEEGRGTDGADIVINKPPAPSHSQPVGVASTASTINGSSAADKGRVLNQRLKRFNTHLSFLNILTLMALTWHLVDLGHRLHFTC
ncbi:uncharacterized protein LOC122659099 [Telopea speciosissima]|uniref:uncharacterized protein LOC122659099 n=1 Tax=Telopea speciosissima TaxID=54955 RepID=UPI001CC3F480|nr:uncharacterized protein LOC122659099 [Telopea speciosissima]